MQLQGSSLPIASACMLTNIETYGQGLQSLICNLCWLASKPACRTGTCEIYCTCRARSCCPPGCASTAASLTAFRRLAGGSEGLPQPTAPEAPGAPACAARIVQRAHHADAAAAAELAVPAAPAFAVLQLKTSNRGHHMLHTCALSSERLPAAAIEAQAGRQAGSSQMFAPGDMCCVGHLVYFAIAP